MAGRDAAVRQLRVELENALELDEICVQVNTAALKMALAEVVRLGDELDAAQSSGDRAWGRETELLNENGQLKRRLRAIALIAPALLGGHEDTNLMVDTILAVTSGKQDPEDAIAVNLGTDWCGNWARTVPNMLDEGAPATESARETTQSTS